MQPAGQTALGELGKGSREGRLARKPPDTAPAAQPAQPRINLQTLDQGPGRRKVEHWLGYECTRQRRTVLRRPTHKAVDVGQMSLNAHQLQNRDEELVALAHRTKFALEPREHSC